jgi:hypothetical protein
MRQNLSIAEDHFELLMGIRRIMAGVPGMIITEFLERGVKILKKVPIF